MDTVDVMQQFNDVLSRFKMKKERYLSSPVKDRYSVLDAGDISYIVDKRSDPWERLADIRYLDHEGEFTQKKFDVTTLDFDKGRAPVDDQIANVMQLDPLGATDYIEGIEKDYAKMQYRSERLKLDIRASPDENVQPKVELPQAVRAAPRRGETIKDKKVSSVPFFDLADLYSPKKFRQRAEFLRTRAEHNEFGYREYPGYKLLPAGFLEKPVYQMTEYARGNDRSNALRKFSRVKSHDSRLVIFFAGGGGEVKTLGSDYEEVVLVTTDDYDSREVVDKKYRKLVPNSVVKFVHYNGLYKNLISENPERVLGMSSEVLEKSTFAHNFFPELARWASRFEKSICFYHLIDSLEHEVGRLPSRIKDFDEDSVLITRFLSLRGSGGKTSVFDPERGEVAVWAHHSAYRDRVATVKPKYVPGVVDTTIADFLGSEMESDIKMRVMMKGEKFVARANIEDYVSAPAVGDFSSGDEMFLYFPAIPVQQVTYDSDCMMNAGGDLVQGMWKGVYKYCLIDGRKHFVDYDDRRSMVKDKLAKLVTMGFRILQPCTYPKWEKNYRIRLFSTEFDSTLVVGNVRKVRSIRNTVKNRVSSERDPVRTLTISGIAKKGNVLVYDPEGECEISNGCSEVSFASGKTLDERFSFITRRSKRWEELCPGVRITEAARGQDQRVDVCKMLNGFPSSVRPSMEEIFEEFFYAQS